MLHRYVKKIRQWRLLLLMLRLLHMQQGCLVSSKSAYQGCVARHAPVRCSISRFQHKRTLNNGQLNKHACNGHQLARAPASDAKLSSSPQSDKSKRKSCIAGGPVAAAKQVMVCQPDQSTARLRVWNCTHQANALRQAGLEPMTNGRARTAVSHKLP